MSVPCEASARKRRRFEKQQFLQDLCLGRRHALTGCGAGKIRLISGWLNWPKDVSQLLRGEPSWGYFQVQEGAPESGVGGPCLWVSMSQGIRSKVGTKFLCEKGGNEP